MIVLEGTEEQYQLRDHHHLVGGDEEQSHMSVQDNLSRGIELKASIR